MTYYIAVVGKCDFLSSNFSSILPKRFVVQTTGCTSQIPGAALPTDSKDSCVTGSVWSVLTSGVMKYM